MIVREGEGQFSSLRISKSEANRSDSSEPQFSGSLRGAFNRVSEPEPSSQHAMKRSNESA